MKAESIISRRTQVSEEAFIELRVWRVPTPLVGSAHDFKYRFAFVVRGVCVLRYDNEAGKGDHKHIGEREVAYGFTSLDALVDDFMADVATWKE